MNAAPATTSSPYQKAAAPAPAISREASLATPALPSAGTGPASGVNQDTSDSQHPPPSQGVPVSVHPPTNPAPRLTRPKVIIDEVPESPQFGNKWTASPSQTQTHVLAQSEAPVAFASVPAAKVQSSDSNAYEKAPKPKDSFVPSVQPTPNVQPTVAVKPSPSVQPNPSGQPTSTVKPSPSAQPTPSVQPTPTAVASTSSHVPPAPSTQQHAYTSTSSRAPFSAPPMQTTFTPLRQDPVHQTTSSGGQPRGYQRSTDAQPSVKAPSTYTSASAIAAQGARHVSQLPNVAQSVSIDVASKGRSYAAVPTTTVTAPHPQNLPTAETHKISSISTSYQRIRYRGANHSTSYSAVEYYSECFC
jgi:hypothetical protein